MDITSAPPPKATRPDRRTAAVSRAPIAQPTRTEPAWPIPTAAQKVKLAIDSRGDTKKTNYLNQGDEMNLLCSLALPVRLVTLDLPL